MPSAGFFHFYNDLEELEVERGYCVNALGGLFSFLQDPLRTRINTGLPGLFLQVFV